jgi:hypothetical protein
MEATENQLAKDHPLRALFLADRPDGASPEWMFNMLLRHGVRSCLEYAKTRDLAHAHALSNRELCCVVRSSREIRACRSERDVRGSGFQPEDRGRKWSAASLGHKGVGFESVLEVTDAPEVFRRPSASASAPPAPSRAFSRS